MEVKKNVVTVGISEMAISTKLDDVLVTHSLGSCVGVALFDPVKNIGGLIHCMLPTSVKEPEKSQINPHMFVDSGVTALLQEIFNLGCERANLICKVAGAGHPMDDSGLFKIGERNYSILKKILWRNNILIKGELIGDKTAKTMFLHMDSGKTIVKVIGKESIEI